MIAPCFPSHGGVNDVVNDVIAGGDDFVVFYQEPTQVR